MFFHIIGFFPVVPTLKIWTLYKKISVQTSQRPKIPSSTIFISYSLKKSTRTFLFDVVLQWKAYKLFVNFVNRFVNRFFFNEYTLLDFTTVLKLSHHCHWWFILIHELSYLSSSRSLYKSVSVYTSSGELLLENLLFNQYKNTH